MNDKVKKFWGDHKDTIKNVTIVTTVIGTVVGIVALSGIHRLNGIITENGLYELFYEDGNEEEDKIKEHEIEDDPKSYDDPEFYALTHNEDGSLNEYGKGLY